VKPSFSIPSSDPALLDKAIRVAEEFARPYQLEGVVGIFFLGALARGYYDRFADIDLGIYTAPGACMPAPDHYTHLQGLEVHSFMADYASELEQPWDMAKRWAFSTHRIFYDPGSLLADLFQKKVVLQAEERNWLMIEGMTQSNWCIDTLPRLWIERGNLVSAHHIFHQGITHFFDALFGLNNTLVADFKWQYFCVEQLPLLPPNFHQGIQEVLRISEFSEAEVERRRQAFMDMWSWVLPRVEAEVKMPYDEFSVLV